MSESTHGSLCRACGFCCDGTFFVRGSLQPDEVAEARAHRLTILSNDGRPGFQQPCSAHDGDRCTIYEARPSCCRNYRCRLLEKVEGGQVAMAEAERHIARVRELSDKIRSVAPPGRKDAPLFALALELVDDATAEPWRRANTELLLDVGELVTTCRRHFGVRDEDKSL